MHFRFTVPSSFYLSEFESRLEASESLEEELNVRLNNTKTEVEALKTADQGERERQKNMVRFPFKSHTDNENSIP